MYHDDTVLAIAFDILADYSMCLLQIDSGVMLELMQTSILTT